MSVWTVFIVDLKAGRFDVDEQRECLHFQRKCDILSVNYSEHGTYCYFPVFFPEEDRM